MKRVAPIAIATLSILWISYLWWGHLPDANLAVWSGSAIAIAAAIAGAIVASPRVRTHAAIAAILMVTLGSFALARVVGHWPFAWDAMADRRYAALIATICFAVGAGLLRGAFWARWAAMAFAASSILGGGLNSLHWLTVRDETAWVAAMGVIGGAILLGELGRAEVASYFARDVKHALWRSRDPLVRTTRWAAIANFGAAPMLVLYALGQPMAPSTVTFALVLAPILAAGSTLVVLGRSLGVAVLGIAGVALCIHTGATAEYAVAGGLPVVGYYAAFWMPAALLGIAAGALAATRIIKS